MKTIMIVDDANTIRTYHKMLITTASRKIEEAENGIEALEKALCSEVDLFMVDVNMPKMDGYRLCQEIRQSPVLQSIPIIMISTESELQDANLAFSCGANYYMTKPVEGQLLNEIVALMLGE